MRQSYTVVLTSVRTFTCQVDAASEEEAIAFARAEVPLGQWAVARSITLSALALGAAQRIARLVQLRASEGREAPPRLGTPHRRGDPRAIEPNVRPYL